MHYAASITHWVATFYIRNVEIKSRHAMDMFLAAGSPIITYLKTTLTAFFLKLKHQADTAQFDEVKTKLIPKQKRTNLVTR